jgi:hypothetical protein
MGAVLLANRSGARSLSTRSETARIGRAGCVAIPAKDPAQLALQRAERAETTQSSWSSKGSVRPRDGGPKAV